MADIFNLLFNAAFEPEVQWSDAFVVTGLPVLLKTPKGNIRAPGSPDAVTEEHMAQFLETVWLKSGGQERTQKSWSEHLRNESIKEAVDFDTQEADGETRPLLRLRVMATQTHVGKQHSVVIRKTNQEVPTLEALGFSPSLQKLKEGTGLVLVTGPTGNGKSTVVSSFIEEIRLGGHAEHIVVVGDPLEWVHPSTSQCVVTSMQVHTDCTSYKQGAEDALRMAPDVIELGEIRDAETAAAALLLGESGHLVFATLQAQTVEGAIAKMMTLTAGQAGSREAIVASLAAVIRTALVPSKDGQHWHIAHEFMLNSAHYKQLLSKTETPMAFAIREALRPNNLKQVSLPLNASLLQLVEQGKISEEAARKASNDVTPTGDLRN